MYEIGCICELNFCEVGEGMGCVLDIDWFDCDYFYLFIWDREKN